jgi:hypothetical protein
MPRACDCRADSPGVARGDKDGGEDAKKAEAQGDGADGNGVEDAGLGIDVVGGDEGENGEGANDVHESDERARAEDRAGQRAAGIVDLFAHGGDKFKAGEGEGDLRPEVDGVPVPCGKHVGAGEVGGGAVAEHDEASYGDKHEQRDVSADAAGVLEPLADVETDDVEEHGNGKQGERDSDQEGAVLSERRAARTEDVSRHGGRGEQEAGKIEEGVDPVSPSCDETMEGSECLARPDVEAAFLRKARRELVDDECAGDEEEESGEGPEADGGSAVVAGGGDPTRAEDGGDVEEQDIPEAHGFAELRSWVAGGWG